MGDTDRKKIFEYFFIARFDETAGPTVTYTWPPDLPEEELRVLKTASQFAVPFYNYTCEAVEKYCFIMTSTAYVKTYGFCRFSPALDSCLCIMSLNQWFEFFYTILDNLSRTVIESKKDPKPFLDGLAKHKMNYPKSDMSLKFDQVDMEAWKMPAMPPENALPKLMESKNLLEYYNAISTDTIISIFTLMLLENRMVFYSSKLGRLTSCIHAACSLLYPLTWQHVLIPILTHDTEKFVWCPTPMIIGVHKGLQTSVENLIRQDSLSYNVIEVNLDENVILCDDSQKDIRLPDAVYYFLRDRLKGMSPDRNRRIITDPLDDNFARAFLDTLVALVGDYRVGLVASEGRVLDPYASEENFNNEKFFATRPESYRSFLEQLVCTQHFQMFCRNRVERMNDGGKTLSDEFEKAKTLYKPISTGRKIGRMAHEGKEKLKSVREKGMDAFKRFADRRNNQSHSQSVYSDNRLTGSVPDLSENSKTPNEVTKHYEMIPESEFTSLMDDPDIQALCQRSKSDPDLLDQSSEEEATQGIVEERPRPPRPRAPSRVLPTIAPPPRPSQPPPPRPSQPPPPRPSQPPALASSKTSQPPALASSKTSQPLRSSQPPPKPPKPAQLRMRGEAGAQQGPVPRPKPRRSIRASIMDDYNETVLISMSPESGNGVDPILKDFDPLTAGDQCDGVETRSRANNLRTEEAGAENIDLLLPMESLVAPLFSPRHHSVESYHTARTSLLDEEVEERRDPTVFDSWLQSQVSQSAKTDGRSSTWTTFDE